MPAAGVGLLDVARNIADLEQCDVAGTAPRWRIVAGPRLERGEVADSQGPTPWLSIVACPLRPLGQVGRRRKIGWPKGGEGAAIDVPAHHFKRALAPGLC